MSNVNMQDSFSIRIEGPASDMHGEAVKFDESYSSSDWTQDALQYSPAISSQHSSSSYLDSLPQSPYLTADVFSDNASLNSNSFSNEFPEYLLNELSSTSSPSLGPVHDPQSPSSPIPLSPSFLPAFGNLALDSEFLLSPPSPDNSTFRSRSTSNAGERNPYSQYDSAVDTLTFSQSVPASRSVSPYSWSTGDESSTLFQTGSRTSPFDHSSVSAYQQPSSFRNQNTDALLPEQEYGPVIYDADQLALSSQTGNSLMTRPTLSQATQDQFLSEIPIRYADSVRITGSSSSSSSLSPSPSISPSQSPLSLSQSHLMPFTEQGTISQSPTSLAVPSHSSASLTVPNTGLHQRRHSYTAGSRTYLSPDAALGDRGRGLSRVNTAPASRLHSHSPYARARDLNSGAPPSTTQNGGSFSYASVPAIQTPSNPVKLKITSERTALASRSRRKEPDAPTRHVCTVPGCNATFTAKHNLTRHTNAHNGVKPYVCPCGQALTSKSDLTRHQKNSKNPVCSVDPELTVPIDHPRYPQYYHDHMP